MGITIFPLTILIIILIILIIIITSHLYIIPWTNNFQLILISILLLLLLFHLHFFLLTFIYIQKIRFPTLIQSFFFLFQKCSIFIQFRLLLIDYSSILI